MLNFLDMKGEIEEIDLKYSLILFEREAIPKPTLFSNRYTFRIVFMIRNSSDNYKFDIYIIDFEFWDQLKIRPCNVKSLIYKNIALIGFLSIAQIWLGYHWHHIAHCFHRIQKTKSYGGSFVIPSYSL
jgi:hypothetical protein